jgi:hypothetical protein
MDSWFTSFSLMFALKEFEILAFGTLRNSRIPGCTLKTDERLKKLWQGADGYRTEGGRNVTALKRYDNSSRCI